MPSPSNPSPSSSSPDRQAPREFQLGKLLLIMIGAFTTVILILFGGELLGSSGYISRLLQLLPTPTQQPQTQLPSTPQQIEQENNAASYLFTAKTSTSALELLQRELDQLETTDFGSAGVFISSVEGLQSDNGHYWAVYINDEYAQVGVSQLQLQAGDQLQLVYEEIDPNKF